jgi:hypothetical protein
VDEKTGGGIDWNLDSMDNDGVVDMMEYPSINTVAVMIKYEDEENQGEDKMTIEDG